MLRGTAALALISLGACSARQLARVDDWQAGGTLAYDVAYRRAPTGGAGVDGVATAAIEARGFAGPSRPGYAFGVELAAGGSHPRGFAWRAIASPIGVATRLGPHGVAGVLAGAGGSGITGHLPAALELPVEAFATVRLGPRVAVSLWAQPSWLPLSDTRDGGAPDVGFVDELRGGLTVRAGRAYHRWGVRSGNGYHLGVVVAEELDTRYVGVTVGYNLDAATD